MFGPHLIIDGSGCNTQKLADRIIIEQVLNDYPAAIGMTKIGGPYIFDYQAPDPAYSGVSGFVIIAESHIAIHTFPELDYFTLDIFSCRNFDPEIAIDYIKQAFEVEQMDRMLLQRGLSFHGPHHGRFSMPEVDSTRGLDDHTSRNHNQQAGDTAPSAPWPTFGQTPDYGTYGEEASNRLAHQPALDSSSPLIEIEPLQINPTASISGLLDKMSSAGGQARALGRAVASWERMVRDPQMQILLALSTPVIAQGLREELVFAAEHAYVDCIVLSAEDLFADLYAALGYTQYVLQEGFEDPAPVREGQEAAVACFTTFESTLEPDVCVTSSDLWLRFGTYLRTHAPRKGLLQAAAASNVQLFTPDLDASTFGSVLHSRRRRGRELHVPLECTQEVSGLAKQLGHASRLGIIQAGTGIADALISQAYEEAISRAGTAPSLVASISLGVPHPTMRADQHEALSASADLILPIALSALAQRVPIRQRTNVAAVSATQGR